MHTKLTQGSHELHTNFTRTAREPHEKCKRSAQTFFLFVVSAFPSFLLTDERASNALHAPAPNPNAAPYRLSIMTLIFTALAARPPRRLLRPKEGQTLHIMHRHSLGSQLPHREQPAHHELPNKKKQREQVEVRHQCDEDKGASLRSSIHARNFAFSQGS